MSKFTTTKFVEASKNGNIERVRLLLNQKPLHHNQRLSSENGEIVTILLKHKADVVDIHHENDQALRLSSYKGHINIVKMLLDHKANVHANNNYALRWSSNNGHTDIVNMLLDNKADVHTDNDFALQAASQRGYYEIVKILLEHEANVHANNNYALRWASRFGHYKTVKTLLDYQADVHTNNDAALQWAYKDAHTEVVKLLILYGANYLDILNIGSQDIGRHESVTSPRKLMELFALYKRLCKHERTTGTQLFHRRDILDCIVQWL